MAAIEHKYQEYDRENTEEIKPQIKELIIAVKNETPSQTEIDGVAELLKEAGKNNWTSIFESIQNQKSKLQKTNATLKARMIKLIDDTIPGFDSAEQDAAAEKRLNQLREGCSDIDFVEKKLDDEEELFSKIKELKTKWMESIMKHYSPYLINNQKHDQYVALDYNTEKWYKEWAPFYEKAMLLSKYKTSHCIRKDDILWDDAKASVNIMQNWIDEFEKRKTEFVADDKINRLINDKRYSKLNLTEEEIAGHCKTKEDVKLYILSKQAFLEANLHDEDAGKKRYDDEMYVHFEEKYDDLVLDSKCSMSTFYLILKENVAPETGEGFNVDANITLLMTHHNAKDESKLPKEIDDRIQYYREKNMAGSLNLYLQTECDFIEYQKFYPELANYKTLANYLNKTKKEPGSDSEFQAISQIQSNYKSLKKKLAQLQSHQTLFPIISKLQKQDPKKL